MKSRHYRDASDPLLGLYCQTLDATTSVRSSYPLYGAEVSNSATVTESASSPLRLFSSLSENDYGTNVDEEAQEKEKLATNAEASRRLPKQSYRIHRVSYSPTNHFQVLFRMHGSAFPSVLPFCCLNICWTFVVHYLRQNEIMDLTFHSSVGHSFMGLLVSFLIVSRSKISYDRFMDYRRLLAKVYHVCRQLMHFATVYTFQVSTDAAIAWRQEVGFRTIDMLRVTMDALLWSSTERDRWAEEYFQIGKDTQDSDRISDHFYRFRTLSHGRRSMIDENFRAPITFAHSLKQIIMLHPRYLGYKMPVNEYRDLLNLVDKFMEAFHEFRVLVFTPYPFSLVQMTRTFLFVWVYTLPMVLLKEYRLWSSLLIVLMVTFGFMGIENICIALEDPVGDDTNDIDEHGMALLVYEDIYLAIYRTDGPQPAKKLRERVVARYRQGRALDCYREDLKGFEIWEPYTCFQPPIDRSKPPSGSASSSAAAAAARPPKSPKQKAPGIKHGTGKDI